MRREEAEGGGQVGSGGANWEQPRPRRAASLPEPPPEAQKVWSLVERLRPHRCPRAGSPLPIPAPPRVSRERQAPGSCRDGGEGLCARRRVVSRRDGDTSAHQNADSGYGYAPDKRRPWCPRNASGTASAGTPPLPPPGLIPKYFPPSLSSWDRKIPRTARPALPAAAQPVTSALPNGPDSSQKLGFPRPMDQCTWTTHGIMEVSAHSHGRRELASQKLLYCPSPPHHIPDHPAPGHSTVTTPRVAPAPAPWGKAPLKYDSAVPSMAHPALPQNSHTPTPATPAYISR
ncbi:polycomb protein sop-2-like [Fukomys damarensis]|uniref:polycomb protein sop-2-like n=1 Tax=Fukomys damarensis TaxID=885580 RepID=UPI0014554CD3|nr:polycomb protein sop-2-like [Fukomys damarensis]